MIHPSKPYTGFAQKVTVAQKRVILLKKTQKELYTRRIICVAMIDNV